jgi:hypothetical protein
VLYGWNWSAYVEDGRNVSAGGARFVALEDVGLLSHRLNKLKVNPKPVLFGTNAVRKLQR